MISPKFLLPIGLGIAAWLLLLGALALHASAVNGVREESYQAGVKAATDMIREEQAAITKREQESATTNEAKQAAIGKDKSNALFDAHDAIDARARAISLRHAAAPRNNGTARSVDMPEAGAAPSQPCPAPAEDGLPWSVALPLMTQAAKDLAQLNAILDLEEAQAALTTEAPDGNP